MDAFSVALVDEDVFSMSVSKSHDISDHTPNRARSCEEQASLKPCMGLGEFAKKPFVKHGTIHLTQALVKLDFVGHIIRNLSLTLFVQPLDGDKTGKNALFVVSLTHQVSESSGGCHPF